MENLRKGRFGMNEISKLKTELDGLMLQRSNIGIIAFNVKMKLNTAIRENVIALLGNSGQWIWHRHVCELMLIRNDDNGKLFDILGMCSGDCRLVRGLHIGYYKGYDGKISLSSDNPWKLVHFAMLWGLDVENMDVLREDCQHLVSYLFDGVAECEIVYGLYEVVDDCMGGSSTYCVAYVFESQLEQAKEQYVPIYPGTVYKHYFEEIDPFKIHSK